VLADLIPDPAAPDGYCWSSGRGPRNPIHSGTLCESGITLERRAPITLVLPLLRRTFGLD
jgi:HlyD family secretion protein